MPYNNDPNNYKLMDAITLGNTSLVEELLDNGADLRATVDVKGSPGKKINLLLHAFDANDELVVDAILKHTEKTGNIIDFSAHDLVQEIEPKNSMPRSILQFACTSTASDVQKLIFAYHLRHNPTKSIASMLNKKFKILHSDGSYKLDTLGTLILADISLRTFLMNGAFPGTTEEQEQAKRYMKIFEYRSTNKPMPASLKAPNAIYILGPVDALDSLIPQGLDVTATDYKGESVVSMTRDLVACSHNAEDWNKKIKLHVAGNHIEQTADAVPYGKGICFEVKITNMFGAHPFLTTAIPNYKELSLKVEAAAKAQTSAPAPLVFALQHQVAQQGALITQVVDDVQEIKEAIKEIFAKLGSLTEEKYNEACRKLSAYPFYLSLFLKLHQATESYIRQKRDAKLNVFPTNPSSNQLVAAQSALTLFNFAAGMCPAPFATIIPAIGQMLLTVGIQMDSARQNKGVFDATLGMKPDHIATCVALRVAAEAMSAYGEKPGSITTNKLDKIAEALFSKVKTQVNSMYRQEFVNPGHMMGYLCEVAINDLRAKSSSSVSVRSQDPMLALMDTQRQTANHSSAACCSMM